jgi:glycosyltransferase involved in cell wall biosynthesis
LIKLSSIIIAKDEEKNLKRCIESQCDVIDDIVVLIDSRTTDKTFEIAKSFSNVNAELIEWKGFGATKNYAISKTKNDWVFWIDADEEFTDELKKELIDFKNSSPEHNSYQVARRAFFLGKWIKHSGWYPSRVTRLFNKNFASFNEKAVHENLVAQGSCGYLKNDLNHYTDPSIEHYFNKFNIYTTLAAKDLSAKNKNVTLFDMIIRPIFLFTKMYIFKRGFLDGLHGLILAVFSSVYVFTKYCKLWELNRSGKK